jgi:hypothetical protein
MCECLVAGLTVADPFAGVAMKRILRERITMFIFEFKKGENPLILV